MADGTITIDTSVDNSGAQKGISKLGTIAGKGFGLITKGVAAAATALGAMATYSVKVGSDFEAGMSKVKAISGASAQEMEKLSAKAKEMGSTTKFSATESAEAMQYMAMAGWKTEDMLNGISGIMNLAAASGEDLATTSDIVTDALTAFGLKASDSAHFADIMASASANANTNVSMLGESFKYVAPVAGSLGYTAEDTAIALGLMANAGIKGSQGGTALRASLSRLVKPTGDVAAAMDQYGITLTNSDGSMKTLGEVMDLLRDKMGGLDEATKAQVATTLFGQEAMSGMLAIINASPEDYNKLTDAIKNCDGTAQEMADTMNDNLQGQITLLKSALEGLGISIYEKFQEPLKEAVKGVNDMVGELQKAFDKGGFEGLAGALGDVIAQCITNIASKLPQFLNLGVKVIQSLIDGIANNSELIVNAVIETGTTFTNAVLSILPQILDLGIRIVVNLANGITQQIPTLIPKVVDCLLSLADALLDNANLIINAGMELINELAKGIAQQYPTIYPEMVECLLGLVDTLLDNIDLLIDAGIELIIGLAEGIANALPKIAEKAPEIIEKLLKAIISNLPELLGAGLYVIETLCTGISNYYSTLHDKVGELMGKLKEYIVGKVEELGTKIKEKIVNAFESFKQTVTEKFNSIKESVSNFFESVKQTISDAMQQAKDKITSICDEIGNFFTETIPGWIESIKQWFMELPDKIGYALGYALGTIVKWGTDAWDYLTTNVPIWIDNIVEWFKSLPDRIWEWLSSAIDKVKQWGTDTYNSAKESVTNTIDSIVNWFSELPGRILVWLLDTLAKIGDWGTEVYNKASKAVSDTINNVVNWFKSLPGKIQEWLNNTINKVKEWGVNLGKKGTEAAKQLKDSIVEGVKSIPKKMESIGKNIVEGIWNGIKNAKDWIVDKIKGFASGVVDGFKDALGIHSPSRVLADMVGKFIPQGISVGMEAEMPNTIDDIKYNVSDLYRELRGTVDIETAKTTASMVGSTNINTSKVVNNDNGITQNVTIVNPERSPSENARALKKAGRDLVFG